MKINAMLQFRIKNAKHQSPLFGMHFYDTNRSSKRNVIK